MGVISCDNIGFRRLWSTDDISTYQTTDGQTMLKEYISLSKVDR